MDGTQAHLGTHETIEHKSTAVAGGAMLEGFGAIATIALAIVGLAGTFSITLAAIATIVAGAAILVEGGVLGAGRSSMVSARASTGLFSGVLAVDLQGGLATVVLGILALLGISSPILLAAAVITLGATFLLNGRFLVGIGGVVLGILAVVGFSPLTLVLIGLLITGAGLIFRGAENAAVAANHSS